MDTKSFLLWLVSILLLVLLLRESLAVSLVLHEIFVNIDTTGKANFTEKFYLSIFPVEKEKFLKDVEENGRSLMRWLIDYDFIRTKFANWQTAKDVEVRYEDKERVLVISYKIDAAFAIKDKEETRSIRWKILESNFQNFLKGSTIVIPEHVVIYITLPKGAYVKEDEIPEGVKIKEKQIILQGINISGLSIYYYFDKPIAPPVGVEQIAKEFMQNAAYQAVVVFLLLGAIILYAKRKFVVKKIEDFILEHSQLSHIEEK